MGYPNWQRPRFNQAGGPIDEYPFASAPPTAGGASSAGGGAPSLGWMLTRQVPEEAPPPGSQYFTQADSLSLAAVGAQQFPNATFILDASNFGVLKSIDFEVTDYTTLSNVQFTVLVNGTPAVGLNAVRIPPANAALKTRGFDLSLPLPKGATVSISVNDLDGGAYIANVTYFGWQWSADIDARYRPEGVGVR